MVGAVFLAAGLLNSCAWVSKFGAHETVERLPVKESGRLAINHREFGRPAVCAVTGALFSIGKSSRAAMFHGRRYYFRDEETLSLFLERPEEYGWEPAVSIWEPED